MVNVYESIEFVLVMETNLFYVELEFELGAAKLKLVGAGAGSRKVNLGRLSIEGLRD
jgi:hypothetical protein